jgi:dephospho-CoA kinase
MLSRQGWRVIDSDAIAHELMEPAGANYQKLVDTFGREILNTDQTINRRCLGQIVFGQPAMRQKLNELTHPAIREAWRSRVADALQASPHYPIVVMIPLLFESGLRSEFVSVLAVGCSLATQRQRLRARGMTDSEMDSRLASQWPVSQKMAESRYAIWTEGSLAVTQSQATRLKQFFPDPS